MSQPKPKTRKQYKGTNYAGYLRGWYMVDARIRKEAGQPIGGRK